MEKHIVFYDGVCNLCDSTVRFIIRRDKNKVFKYAGLQSDYARLELSRFNLSVDNSKLVSIIYLDQAKLYYKSDAVLRICKRLRGLWPIMYAFIIVPKPIRNWVYDLIAKNRYKWFGKKDVCTIPLKVDKSLFLDLN